MKRNVAAKPCAGKSRTELRRLKCSLTLNLNPRTGLYLTMSMLSVGLVTSEHTESSLSERILAWWVSLNQLKVIANTESHSMDYEISFGSERDIWVCCRLMHHKRTLSITFQWSILSYTQEVSEILSFNIGCSFGLRIQCKYSFVLDNPSSMV